MLKSINIMSNDQKLLKYAPIPIGKLQPDCPLPANIYLNIAGKYIQFKHAGDALSGDKYNYFLSKNLENIFIKADDLEAFSNWILNARQLAVDQIVAQAKLEKAQVVLAEKREKIKEKVYETFAKEELTSENVQIIKSQVEDFIGEVSGKKANQLALARLLKISDAIADHSINVANLSVFMGMVLGNSSPLVLENIYLGALLHDYGKIKIPTNVLENPQSAQYTSAIRLHPEKGVVIISQMENVNDHVKTIVLQHHEQFGGNGYPHGISGDDIYGLARIVNIANIFDNTLAANLRMAPNERVKKAIKILEYDRGKQFDPAMVGPIVIALKKSYKL